MASVIVGMKVAMSMSPATSRQHLTTLLLLFVRAFVNGQSGLEISASPNPLYIAETVTLDCVFGRGFSILLAEVTVFNEEELIGYLMYNCAGGGLPIINGTGVLSGGSATGCGVQGSTSFSTYFFNVLRLNMDVNCSATLMTFETLTTVRLSSSVLNLVVLAVPEAPQFSPAQPMFYNERNATITCTSLGGNPAAILQLDIKTNQMNDLLHTASGLGSISVTWMMSKRYHNAIATCRITNHFRTTYPAAAYIHQYGLTELTFSSNPVYEYDSISLQCSFNSDCSQSSYRCAMNISAYNRTELMGYFFSYSYFGYYNTSGVFLFSYVYYDWNLWVANVRMTIYRNRELDYVCTFYSYNAPSQVYSTTSATRLEVFIAPSSPVLIPGQLTFIDSNRVNISCKTYSIGKPEAVLQLRLSSTQQQTQTLSNGTGFASIRLTVSRAWHGANVSCNVMNHNRPNMKIEGVMQVIHLAINRYPDVTYTHYDEATLDCANYVLGFPEPTFQWSVPTHFNTSDVVTLSRRYFRVLQTQSGLLNCTATNPVTGKTVTVPFVLSDALPVASVPSPGDIAGASLGSLAAIATVVIVTVIIIRKRRSNVNSRLFKFFFRTKQQDTQGNPGNVYVTSTGPGFVAATMDDIEHNQNDPHVYGVLGENLEDSLSTYSTLERTYQNNANMDRFET